VCKGNSQPILECAHEEADTRVVVHIMHCLTNGYKRIKVHTVDTDLVVILIDKFFFYPEIERAAFGVWQIIPFNCLAHLSASKNTSFSS